jgi:hypothetical protein
VVGVVHPEGVVEGMLLAAVVLDDRSGDALAGASSSLAELVRARLRELDALPRERRHRAIRALVQRSTAITGREDVPPRAGAILAADAPTEAARRWTAAAPPVRRGFEVSRSLKTALRRLASEASADTANEDRAAAARVDELPPARTASLRRIALALGEPDVERATGALRLGLDGRIDGDSQSRRLRRIGAELALVWSLEERDGDQGCRE